MRKYRPEQPAQKCSFLRIFVNFCEKVEIFVIFCDFLPPISAQLAHLIENQARKLTRKPPVFAAQLFSTVNPSDKPTK
jgi:hypothetical protein